MRTIVRTKSIREIVVAGRFADLARAVIDGREIAILKVKEASHASKGPFQAGKNDRGITLQG